jgi:hypothetical protein
MHDSLKNLLLVFDVVDMLAVDDLRLFHRLNRKLLARPDSEPANPNVAEST